MKGYKTKGDFFQSRNKNFYKFKRNACSFCEIMVK